MPPVEPVIEPLGLRSRLDRARESDGRPRRGGRRVSSPRGSHGQALETAGATGEHEAGHANGPLRVGRGADEVSREELEPVTESRPACPAWEAGALPLSYAGVPGHGRPATSPAPGS